MKGTIYRKGQRKRAKKTRLVFAKPASCTQRECFAPLAWREMRIQRHAVLLRQVIDDQTGIRNGSTVVLDVQHLAPGRFAQIRAARTLAGQARHTQPGVQLHAEGAGVGQAKGGWKLIKLHHKQLFLNGFLNPSPCSGAPPVHRARLAEFSNTHSSTRRPAWKH